MEWFRFYHEVVDDPKVQRLSPVLFKHWINVLCLASRNSERGAVPSVADLAFGLRLSEPKVRSICAELIAADLIERDGDQLRMHGWSKRQKRSDDVTPRVNKHRASNDFETLQETPDETLQETLPRVRVENRGEQNREEESPPTPLRGKRGVRLPDEFPISDEMRQWAATETPGLDIEYHHKQFCRYWWGESGQHATKANWVSTWEKWMAKEHHDKPTALNGMPPEIKSLPWNNAQRMKWENDHRAPA